MERIGLSQPEELPSAEVYVSIANLVRKFIVVGEAGVATEHYVAIRGKDLEGKPRYQALGGGAKLTATAKTELENSFGANIRFRDGEEADDARFYITTPLARPATGAISPADLPESVLAVTEAFSALDVRVIEDSVDRELKEEISELDLGLSGDELEQMQAHYETSVCPPETRVSNSGRSKGADLNFRVFHLFDVTVPQAVFEKLCLSDRFRVLSKTDMEAFRQATESRETKAVAQDDVYLVENLFPDEHPDYSRITSEKISVQE